MKAFLIDSAARKITEVEYELGDVSRLIGGDGICLGFRFRNGDLLYVDDKGLLKPQEHFFWISDRTDQPLAGNGLVAGPDRLDETLDVQMSYDTLKAKVTFIDREGVDMWTEGLPLNIPGTTLNGRLITTLKETFQSIPRPDGYVSPVIQMVPVADKPWLDYLEKHKVDITAAIRKFAPSIASSGLWEKALEEKNISALIRLMQIARQSIYAKHDFPELCALLDGTVGNITIKPRK